MYWPRHSLIFVKAKTLADLYLHVWAKTLADLCLHVGAETLAELCLHVLAKKLANSCLYVRPIHQLICAFMNEPGHLLNYVWFRRRCHLKELFMDAHTDDNGQNVITKTHLVTVWQVS